MIPGSLKDTLWQGQSRRACFIWDSPVAVHHGRERSPQPCLSFLFCGAVNYCIVLSLYLSLSSLSHLRCLCWHSEQSSGMSVFLYIYFCVCLYIGVTENTGTVSSVQILLNIVSDSHVTKGTLIQWNRWLSVCELRLVSSVLWSVQILFPRLINFNKERLSPL